MEAKSRMERRTRLSAARPCPECGPCLVTPRSLKPLPLRLPAGLLGKSLDHRPRSRGDGAGPGAAGRQRHPVALPGRQGAGPALGYGEGWRGWRGLCGGASGACPERSPFFPASCCRTHAIIPQSSTVRPPQSFCDLEAIYTYEGTYEVNVLVAARRITGVSAIKAAPPAAKQPGGKKGGKQAEAENERK
jgi:hypothetical protein